MAQPVPTTCDCKTCRRLAALPGPDEQEVIVMPDSSESPRPVPTAWPLDPGQLDPNTPPEPEPPAGPVDADAEAIRRKLLVAQGGLEGSASRTLHVSQRPDHMPGL
jgi:hypothetical protein